jgi:molecular chaperone Hsp33
MIEQDFIQRFLFENLGIRGCYSRLEDSWQEVTSRRDYPEPIKSHLGHAFVGMALLQSNLKTPTKLTFQIQPNGAKTPEESTDPLQLLVVQADHNGHLRAMAKWNKQSLQTLQEAKTAEGLISLKALCPNAICAITMEPETGQAYQGVVPIDGNSIADSLTAYFQNSEQLNTSVILSENQGQLTGFLLQSIPASLLTTEIDQSTLKQHWQHVSTLAETLKLEELNDLSLETLLHRLFHEEQLRLFDSEPAQFICKCSEQQMLSVLSQFDNEAVASMIGDSGKVEVTCEFCGNEQAYDLIDITAAKNQSPAFDQIANNEKGQLH